MLQAVETKNVTCPAHSRHEGDLVGCGSSNVSGPDEEGLYDCHECGLFFADPRREEIAMVAKVTKAFKRYEDELVKCRKDGTAKGAERRKALKEYEAAKIELQPLGEWSITQVRAVLEKIRAAISLPPGYRTRMTEEGRPFVAGCINTPDDISLYMEKPDASLDDPDQFSFEVRLFLNRPYLIVFFTVGEQHSFKGRRVNVFTDGPRANGETFSELADVTIAALRQTIEAEGFCRSC